MYETEFPLGVTTKFDVVTISSELLNVCVMETHVNHVIKNAMVK